MMGINALSTVLLLYVPVAQRASVKGTLFVRASVLAGLCGTCPASQTPWLSLAWP